MTPMKWHKQQTGKLTNKIVCKTGGEIINGESCLGRHTDETARTMKKKGGQKHGTAGH